MKVIEVYQEITARHVEQLANWISTVEQRYEQHGQVTNKAFEFEKVGDVWEADYDAVRDNMGDIGKQIMDFFLGTYAPTGDPVVNKDVLRLIEK